MDLKMNTLLLTTCLIFVYCPINQISTDAAINTAKPPSHSSKLSEQSQKLQQNAQSDTLNSSTGTPSVTGKNIFTKTVQSHTTPPVASPRNKRESNDFLLEAAQLPSSGLDGSTYSSPGVNAYSLPDLSKYLVLPAEDSYGEDSNGDGINEDISSSSESSDVVDNIIPYSMLQDVDLRSHPRFIEDMNNEVDKRPREFVGKRAREFIGKRARELVGKRAREFVGKRAREFVGKRAREFVGKRAREFVGKRAREFIGKRSREFVGKRAIDILLDRARDHLLSKLINGGLDEKRAREFIGKRAREFIGKRAREFIGKRAREFIGKRAREFVGKRAREFIGKRAREFIGKRAREFVGKRAREFIGKRQDIDSEKRAREFVGKRAREFVGKRAREFVGKRAREFVGKRAMEFVGKRGDVDFNLADDFTSQPYLSDNTESPYDEDPFAFVGLQGRRYQYNTNDLVPPPSDLSSSEEVYNGHSGSYPLMDIEGYYSEVSKRPREFVGKRSTELDGLMVSKRPREFVGR